MYTHTHTHIHTQTHMNTHTCPGTTYCSGAVRMWTTPLVYAAIRAENYGMFFFNGGSIGLVEPAVFTHKE